MASIARIALRGVALATGAGTAGLAATPFVAPDSGVARSVKFWSGVMPIYAHYKIVERRVAGMTDDEATVYYKPLHDRYSPIVEKMTVNLQGFYYKLAQVASTRDEFMPDEYMSWAKRLQTKSPRTLPGDEIRTVVEKGLGRPVDSIFSRFDDTPIGAASIGQVHRAKLRDTGEEVVVKVQFPGIESKFRSDINTVERFCVNFMPQNAPFFRELRKQFQTEFDYVGEAQNLAEVHANLGASQFAADVAVPRPYLDLCSKEVLVMSYLPGESMVEGVRERYRRIAEARGIDMAAMEAEQKALLADGKRERSDLKSSAQSMAMLSWAMWLRDSSVNVFLWAANWTVAPLLWHNGWEYWRTELPINLGAILETLLRVHAHEIFFDGGFNADCHPGNVLLMPDGRLGLIDYGQFKRMTVADRVIYAKMVLALHRDDRKEIVRIMTDEVGFRTKNMDEDIIYRTAVFWNDRDTDDVTLGMDVHHFLEYLDETDPAVQLNDEFIMVGRTSMLLRGMANAFGLRLRVSDYWRHEAKAFLDQQGVSYKS